MRDYIKRRDELGKFYKSKQWEQVRQVALMRDKFLCQRCGRPAEVVHHKTRLSPENVNDATVSLNLENLESLCSECHFAEHKGEHARGRIAQEQNPYEFDANGQLIPKK